MKGKRRLELKRMCNKLDEASILFLIWYKKRFHYNVDYNIDYNYHREIDLMYLLVKNQAIRLMRNDGCKVYYRWIDESVGLCTFRLQHMFLGPSTSLH